jgi:multiple sugar transport system permease protein/sn-glycerol 3-phosphate transport system permease protein
MSTTTDTVALGQRAAPVARPARPAARRAGGQLVLHATFVIACLVTLFPLAWMLRTAFAPSHDVFRHLSLWPDHATLGNFAGAFRLHPVGTWFANSVVVAGAITLGKLALSVPAGFAFGVMTFRGRDAAFVLVVGTMTVPYVITLLPTYVAVASIGLYDTLTGVIVPVIGHCGFVVFFLRQAFKSLPRELFEAARIDGAGSWRQMLQIALPNIWAPWQRWRCCRSWVRGILPLAASHPDVTEHKTLSIGLKPFATTGELGGIVDP